jgi:hypothetical protein
MHETLARIATFLGVKVIKDRSKNIIREEDLPQHIKDEFNARDAYEHDIRQHRSFIASYKGSPTDQRIISEKRDLAATIKFLDNTNANITQYLHALGYSEQEAK